ncbi:MAG: acetoin:2,6-dichlorophenolindophenol oxidoreductase subunit alpha [Gaiellales bacterium]|nr:acetoin:2,6-dichlorophenolindophenol oxidoreductase subunit alpha [Gaiellales bacterium]
MTAEAGQALGTLREMLRIRRFEEHVGDLYARGEIPGIAHLSIGQEAVAVGICGELAADDYITSTHRGHGHCLAKGAEPGRMFAELLGRSAGYCRGKGGSMHIADPATGNLGANAIVGGSMAIATGAALSSKLRKSRQVAVCFFGDGALNQGLLHESMNMASLWNLPVVYVCEHNHYGEYTSTEEATAGVISRRGEALGVHTDVVDGMDVEAVSGAARGAVARARAGEGPSFLICETYRYFGHGMSDRDRAYRTRDEEQEWRSRDPIERYQATALARESVTEALISELRGAIDAEMEVAIEFARQSPEPGVEEVSTHVYVD